MRLKSKLSQLIHSGPTSCAALKMPRWKEARLRLPARPSIRKSSWFNVCLPSAFSIPTTLPVQFTFFRPAPGRGLGSSKAGVPSAVAALGSEGRDESAVSGRHHYEADSQERDRVQVGAEISPGSEDHRDIKEWRQEEKEHDLRVELDLQQELHEARSEEGRVGKE